MTAYAGAPLKGVDIKLGKNPGGSAAQRLTSDGAGKADFGVVPAGSYQLTFSLPSQDGDADVEVTGGVAGPIKRRWNFKENKAYDPNTPSTARAAGQPYIVVDSSGKQPLQVTIVSRRRISRTTDSSARSPLTLTLSPPR